MVAALRRFLADLFDGPVTVRGMTTEAKVDAGLLEDRTDGDDEVAASLTAARRGWQVERNADLRLLSKRFAHRDDLRGR